MFSTVKSRRTFTSHGKDESKILLLEIKRRSFGIDQIWQSVSRGATDAEKSTTKIPVQKCAAYTEYFFPYFLYLSYLSWSSWLLELWRPCWCSMQKENFFGRINMQMEIIFAFDHQRGRRDVTCKPSILDERRFRWKTDGKRCGNNGVRRYPYRGSTCSRIPNNLKLLTNI